MNVVRSFVKICFDRHLARTSSSCGFLVCIPTLAGVFHQKGGRLWWNSFKWMQEQAASAGLYFDAEKLNALVAEKPSQAWAEPINSSFEPATWYLGEIWPKLTYCPKLKIRYPRCNFGRYREIHSGALIDQAALVRIRAPDLAYISKKPAKDVYFLC